MGHSKSIRNELAREYAENYPHSGTLTLSKMLYSDHPSVFLDVEKARSSVRWVRGQKKNGDGNTVLNPVEMKPALLPKSFAPAYKPVEMPFTGYGTIMSDMHVPYHDETAIYAAVEKAEKEGATDFLILNGDIMDAHPISRYQHDPRLRTFKEEIAAMKQLFTFIFQHFDKVVYKFGNHEYRFENFMLRASPQLLGIEEFQLEEILKLRDQDIVYIPHNIPLFVGSLTILHGHEHGHGSTNPVNPARGQFLRAGSSSMVGHWHRSSQHTQNTVRGKTLSFWSLGCLSDLHPAYSPQNQWDHGFALIQFDGDQYEVQPHKIIKGRVF